MGPLDSYADRPLWIRWRTEPRAPGKPPTKVPYQLTVARRSSKDAPGRGTRAKAETAAAAPGNWSGIGIVLGAPTRAAGVFLAGLDLDTCLDPHRNVAAWARAVVDAFSTYTEISPSGTGLKLYFEVRLCDLPAIRSAIGTGAYGKSWKRGNDAHPPAIELYLNGRWFAVTGNLLPGSTAELRTIPSATLLTLIHKTGPAFQGGNPGASKPKRPGGRSEKAISIANRVKRNGGTKEVYEEALADDPDTATWVADHDQRQIDRAWDRAQPAGAQLADMEGFGLNEDDMAQAFAARHRSDLRFCHHTRSWYEWTGVYWRREETKLAFHWARMICRDFRLRAAAESAAGQLARIHTAAAVEQACRADRAFAVRSEIWDRDPWLLGTPAGTVELKTGKLRGARQEDLITKTTAVAPKADFWPVIHCPRWLRFLNEITGGDAQLIRFLQQWFGYSLTGEIREQCLVFAFGPGGNGKGVLLNTISGVLGDYAMTADMDTFAASNFSRHTQDIATLRGARLVGASETEEGRAWAETRIKAMTGGDKITAHFMRQNNFTYKPQFKLTIIGNNKPVLRNVDAAARRRFNIVPFNFVPKEPDLELESKLKAEWPEILAWMIEGCLDWQESGLTRPDVVIAATEEYFADQDIFGQWLAARCELGKTYNAGATELYESYCEFARGEKAKSTVWFSDELRKRGFEKAPTRKGVVYDGLRLHKIEDDHGFDDPL